MVGSNFFFLHLFFFWYSRADSLVFFFIFHFLSPPRCLFFIISRNFNKSRFVGGVVFSKLCLCLYDVCCCFNSFVLTGEATITEGLVPRRETETDRKTDKLRDSNRQKKCDKSISEFHPITSLLF